jgi:hypothetical protein
MTDGGLPSQQELNRWLSQHRDALKQQRKSGGIRPDFIVKLGSACEALDRAGRHEDALRVIDLAVEGVMYVRTLGQKCIYPTWREK